MYINLILELDNFIQQMQYCSFKSVLFTLHLHSTTEMQLFAAIHYVVRIIRWWINSSWENCIVHNRPNRNVPIWLLSRTRGLLYLIGKPEIKIKRKKKLSNNSITPSVFRERSIHLHRKMKMLKTPYTHVRYNSRLLWAIVQRTVTVSGSREFSLERLRPRRKSEYGFIEVLVRTMTI